MTAPEFLEAILQALITGLLLGSLYGLMSTGIGLIWGIMRVVNFAQGEFLMLGMYVALFTTVSLGDGLLARVGGPYVGAVVAGLLLAALGYGLHRLLLTKMTGISTLNADSQGHYPQLILTLGVSLIMQNVALIAFGSTAVSTGSPLAARSWQFLPFGDDVVLFLNQARFVAGLISVAVAIALYLFVTRTRKGRALRSAAENPIAAIYMGIDVPQVHRLAFGIGVGVTAVAGALLATFYPIHPFVGVDFVMIMYAGVVLGGLGSILGAFWGGLIIGLIQQLSTLFLSVQLQNAAIFVVFLLIIFVWPQGIFGKNVERV